MSRHPMNAIVMAATLLALGGCGGEVGTRGASLGIGVSMLREELEANGECAVAVDAATLSTRPATVAPGIGECDLVRIKGSRPAQIQIMNFMGTRRLRAEYDLAGGGREAFVFVDRKLTEIIPRV